MFIFDIISLIMKSAITSLNGSHCGNMRTIISITFLCFHVMNGLLFTHPVYILMSRITIVSGRMINFVVAFVFLLCFFIVFFLLLLLVLSSLDEFHMYFLNFIFSGLRFAGQVKYSQIDDHIRTWV